MKQADKHGKSERQVRLPEMLFPACDKQAASGFKTEKLLQSQDNTGDTFLCVSTINQFPILP